MRDCMPRHARCFDCVRTSLWQALCSSAAPHHAVTLAEVDEIKARLRRTGAWLTATRAAMGAPCELLELQREAEALRQRAGASKKWTQRVNNELLRRTSSRKAGGARLTVADVHGLLPEAAALRLEAAEIAQVREKL